MGDGNRNERYEDEMGIYWYTAILSRIHPHDGEITKECIYAYAFAENATQAIGQAMETCQIKYPKEQGYGDYGNVIIWAENTHAETH